MRHSWSKSTNNQCPTCGLRRRLIKLSTLIYIYADSDERPLKSRGSRLPPCGEGIYRKTPLTNEKMMDVLKDITYADPEPTVLLWIDNSMLLQVRLTNPKSVEESYVGDISGSSLNRYDVNDVCMDNGDKVQLTIAGGKMSITNAMNGYGENIFEQRKDFIITITPKI